MFIKYAVNITKDPKAEVQMIDGRLKIKIDGWEGITAREIEHEDVVQAVRRQWIRLDDKQPETPAAPEQPKPYAVAEAKKEEAVATPLGAQPATAQPAAQTEKKVAKAK